MRTLFKLFVVALVLTAVSIGWRFKQLKADAFDDMMKRNPGLMIGVYPTPDVVGTTDTVLSSGIVIGVEEVPNNIIFDFGTNSIFINATNGRVTVKGFTLDEASSNFWVSVEKAWPVFKRSILTEHSKHLKIGDVLEVDASRTLVPYKKPDKRTDAMKFIDKLLTTQPPKWGDLFSVDEDLSLVRVTPESVRKNMDRIAEIAGSIIGDPLNRGATILYVGHMRTNYHFTTNFTGAIQVGTNFYSVEDLMK